MNEDTPTPDIAQVDRAIRLTYAQMMFGAVFAASTGGMFLVGFALQLGADNVFLGLLATVPACMVIFQFLAAYLVENGISRKKLTLAFALATPVCWLLIAAIPLLGDRLGLTGRLGVLLGVIALVTVTTQMSGNARASWLGELIPQSRRGRFFGTCTLFAGIVAAVFSVGEGRFLDFAHAHGLTAFAGLFFFGSLFGLVAALLNVPQADCPLPVQKERHRAVLWPPVRDMVRNRPLMVLMMVHTVMALGSMAGPFGPAYLLRDVGLGFFGLGLLNALATASMLLFAPLWGKFIDRIGCRPVLVVGLLIMGPTAAVWFFIPPGAWKAAYWLLPWGFFICSLASAGVNVAITTLLYKVSSPQGRSVQFAAYAMFIALVSAPMPVLGGWLIDAMNRAGWGVDLRLTFFFWAVMMLAAGGVAYFIHEPRAIRTRTLVFGYFPGMLIRWRNSLGVMPLLTSLIRPKDSDSPPRGPGEPGV